MMKNMKPGTRAKVHGSEYVTTLVKIVGNVSNPRSFSREELRSMVQVAAEGFTITCGSGKVKDEPRTLRGVLLRDILEAADVILREHESPNRTYVVAKGSDGYVSLFSWHEIFNSSLGEGVIVVLEKDGKPLGEDEGELCLVSARDERPGPRRVRYLESVEVREIQDGQ